MGAVALTPPGPGGHGYQVICFQAEQHALRGSYNGTISWCGQVLKDGGYRYIVWEESNPVSVSGILGSKCYRLFLNASQGLAGAGVRLLAARQF